VKAAREVMSAVKSRMSDWFKLTQRVSRYLTGNPGVREVERSASTDYEIVESEHLLSTDLGGWSDREVSERQDAAYRELIRQIRQGTIRQDLWAAAEAVRRTDLQHPAILEVGCGSGYYSEILPLLLERPLRYVGLDSSRAMIRLARRRYGDRHFVEGDATALPFRKGAADIVLNGASLMHILRYREAIAESRRVARRWVIFHTVPILERRKTTILRKNAYGRPTVEVVFNAAELHREFEHAGLAVDHVLDSVPYDLAAVLGEPTASRTYVCHIHGGEV
jgi:ubiquinone/menaquinone biosynthesis C-methylase UbiE